MFSQKTLLILTLIVVFAPLFGSILAGLRSNYLYCRYDHPIFFSIFCLFLSFSLSCILLLSALTENFIPFSYTWYHGTWFLSNSYNITWSFTLDLLTVSMFLIVSTVSLLVHLYSVSYMRGDFGISRFFSFLSLFTFFMLFLVSAGNLVQLFIGWEGVGLCSFLLISFWTERAAANKAAIKAMVVNKVGDCFFLVGTALFLQLVGHTDFSLLQYNLDSLSFYSVFFSETLFFGFNVNSVFPVLLFFFFGIMAKSAQFGFHTWLPDAMEGPTPVSALIHAATMVTAGVFLLLRLSSFFSLSSSVSFFVAVIGLLTMFFAASTALFQNDFKRVIAYSTCSQLGYMVAACGLSFYGVAFFHLLTHAFFKALLFLCAGSVIHFFADEQDFRKMGGISKFLPITFICFVVATLSLLGFPFTSGFFSKDWLLELFFIKSSSFSFYAYLVGVLTATFTAFYSFRLLFISFLGGPLGFRTTYFNYHAEDALISFVFCVLFIPTIFFGYFYKSFYSSAVLFPADLYSPITLSLPLFFKVLPLFTIIIGFFAAYAFVYYVSLNHLFSRFYSVFTFFSLKWFIDHIYNYFVSLTVLNFSKKYVFLGVEKGWIEFLGPTGIQKLSTHVSSTVIRLQTGIFFDYTFFFLFGFVGYFL